MNQAIFMPQINNSPKLLKKHIRFSSDIVENSNNNIILTENEFNFGNRYKIPQHYYDDSCSINNKKKVYFCENENRNKSSVQFDNCALNEKEFNSLKTEINKLLHDYSSLISELNFWKKVLDKKIATFMKNIQSCIDNDFNFVNNFGQNAQNNNNCLKLKEIYCSLFRKDINDNDLKQNFTKDIIKPFLNSHDFIYSKNILNEIISSNNEINNMDKFINCSLNVLKYVIEINKKCINYNSFRKFNLENNYKRNPSEINEISRFNIGKEGFKPNYLDNKIIEKYIDFKDYSNARSKKLSLSLKSYCNITPKNINKNYFTRNIFEKNSKSLKTSQSSNNIWFTPIKNNKKSVYLRKSVTPMITEGFCKNFRFETINKNNGSINLVLNSTKTIEGNKYLNKSCSMKNNFLLNKTVKNFDLYDINCPSKIQFKAKNKYDSQDKINLNKSLKNSVKEKEKKTYIHKKLFKSNLMHTNLQENIEKLNKKNHISSNINLFQNNNDKILDTENFTSHYNKYLINNKSNNKIKSSLFNSIIKNHDIKKSNKEERKQNYIIKKEIKVIKLNSDDKIFIEKNRPLNIGMDIGDTNCVLSVIDEVNNEIKLINFKKDLYKIPTVIYFNKDNEEIKIGQEAENCGDMEPTQIIFNLLKFVGVKYDDIIGKKELLPFKIYKNESNKKPYIKIDYNHQKEKIFYFETILSFFIQKLFEKLFQKIVPLNYQDKTINLNLELSVPNYLSYVQKKVIEKIIQNQFLPDKKYNNFNINLKKINFENASNIAYLYNGIKDNNIMNNGNILIIYLDRCSINLSIVNKNKNNYEVKAVESASFGEEDLNDNYICYFIRNLEKKIDINILNSPYFLYQIRKNISLFKKNIDIIQKSQINIQIPNHNSKTDNDNINIVLKKEDYEKCCEEFFKRISGLIRNIINKNNINIQQIVHFVLIGQTCKSLKIKSLLLDIFKENKITSNLLMSNKNIESDYLPSLGCSIQFLNNNNLLSNSYSFTDICPVSFGVESYDGTTEIIIPKKSTLPFKNMKLIKINNNLSNNFVINIYEGEDKYSKNNKFIISVYIDKSDLGENYIDKIIDMYIQLEIDTNYNMKCFIFEPKSKNKFECLINFDLIIN